MKPQSEETRLKRRAAKLGRKHTPEHNARIAESIRRNWEGRRFLHLLTEEERRLYRSLRYQCGRPRNEVLAAIGRSDLIKRREE